MHGSEQSGSKREGYLILGICILALMVRVIFSFVIFPQLAGPLDLGRAPDKFDELAINLVEGRGFTYSGEIEPKLLKAPAILFFWPLSMPYLVAWFLQPWLFSVLSVVSYVL